MAMFRRFGRVRNLITEFFRAKAGNVAVIFAVAVVPIIGAIGTAVDYSRASDVKSHLQAAIDAAVLAGSTQPSAQQISTASAVFSGNYNGTLATATTSFVQNSGGSLTGTASSSVNASFLGVFGISSLAVNATSTASPGAQAKANVCILLVNPSASQSLLVNSGAQINAPNCEIDVLSTQNPAAMFNASLNVQSICIAGSTIVKNGGANPPAVTNCAAISDPFAGKLPSVTVGACNFNNQTFPQNNATSVPPLNPGVYCGSTNFNGSGTLTLNPGVYVIDGTMTINSGWTVAGTGVTFYLANATSSIQFNSGVTANLSAPTSGTYANILMFEPSGLSNSNSLTIDGSSSESLTGLIYLPSRAVTINSVSNMTTNDVTMVFSTLILNSTNWSIAAGALPMTRSTGTAASAFLSQ
jgi:Flp pilus assembly protein TadG